MAETASILVVDDRADKLLVLGSLLEPLGQNVVLAHSARRRSRRCSRTSSR
jgi:CheY-like chemotaxis protein